MAYDFSKKGFSSINFLLSKLSFELSDEDKNRLKRIERAWDFYEGYHWQEITDVNQPQVTINYCKRFVNKLVSFEFGKGFVIKMLPQIEDISDGNNPLLFLEEVWKLNKKAEKLLELGQSKAVTGDGWLQAYFEPKYIDGKLNPDFDDPFDEYEKGKLRIIVVPSTICFPEYDDYDKDKLVKLTIMFLRKKTRENFFGKLKSDYILYRQIWTKDEIVEYEGEEEISRIPNKYTMIPFTHIKNYPLHGKNYGLSDIDDIIPINQEYNFKKSNMSEIIDYHSAPITLVFGARVSNLERGANKVWGGLPKDAKIENLKLEGELDAAQRYIADLKNELLEVSGIPLNSLGGEMNISNTSAIALQITLMPLIEVINTKHELDKNGLATFNKLLLHIALVENLIEIPEGVAKKDFLDNEILFDNILPKDAIAELQQIDMERRMMLITREEALKRLGTSNIQTKLKDIDAEIKNHPEFYGLLDNEEINQNKFGEEKEINAGYTNSPEKPYKPSV